MTTQSQSIRWWSLPAESRATLDGVWSTVRELDTLDQTRLDAWARYILQSPYPICPRH